MSETNTGPPSDASRGSHPRRGRGRHRGGFNGHPRPMRKYPRPPPSETQTESPKSSALQLETNEQAPSAPTASKDPPDLSLPPKPVAAIEDLKSRRAQAPQKPRGPKAEKPPVVDQPSTSEKQPQVSTPAPKADSIASPAPSACGSLINPPKRGSRNAKRGGRSGPKQRPEKQPMKGSSSISTPRAPSMEPDSSSASSMSVLTPPQAPASLASEDHPPSGSQMVNGRKNKGKKPKFQAGPVSLDMWAENAPSEDMWKTESAQSSWDSQIPTTAIHIDPRPTADAKPSVLASVDEHPPSTSQSSKGPRNDQRSQSPSKPVGLDTWAESTPNDDFWYSEPTPKPQVSHIPAPPATQPDRPTPAAAPSSKPPAPASVGRNTPSGSRPNREPKRDSKPPPPARPASLDTWAESTPNEDVWKLEPTPTQSPRPPHAPIPSAHLDRRPTPSTTPSNDPSGSAHAIQPPVDDSPTAMRRVGLAHVLFGPGACVQTVYTDAESPWVMLSNLPRNFKRQNLQPLLAPFGSTRHIKMIEARRETKYLPSARILFENHEQARYAVGNLQGQLVNGKPIAARLDTDAAGALHTKNIPGLNDNGAASPANKPQSSLIANDTMAIIKSATVKVTWFAPTSTVYVTYRQAKFAIDRVKEMNGRTFMNRRVKMALMFPERGNNLEEIARENGGFIVRITGLMGDPEMDKLRRFVRSDDVVVHPNYSSEAALPTLREELADIAPLESFRLLPHRRDDLKLHALAQYTTPAAAAAAVKVFEGRRGEYLGNSPILVSRHLTVRYSISSKLAEVLQGEINKLHSWAIDDPDLLVRQNEDQYKPGFIQLLLAGNDTKQLVTAKSQLDRALGGIPLTTVDGVKIWDSYFMTEEGALFLESVAEKCKVCARVDKRTNSILLFGPRYAREEASQQLRAKLVSHSRLRHVVRIQKPVFRRLAAGGITILRDLLGKGGIYVDLLDETLTFYGNDEVALRVQKALDLMYSETGSKLRRRSDCVVCFCRPEKALLLACGHHYCKSCFTQYVASAAENRTLPLLCVGDGCKASIPLSLITLHANQPDQEALFYAAFQAYVTSHPDQYRYCPTPDCQYIYRVGPEDAAVQCRLCLSNICTHCHVEQHEGISCADYKASHDESEIQKSFDRWRAANNVKPCPNCAAPIEKIAGCNHMMCSACRTHMCWVCLAGFSKGDEVYDHMRKKHGGIGL